METTIALLILVLALLGVIEVFSMLCNALGFPAGNCIVIEGKVDQTNQFERVVHLAKISADNTPFSVTVRIISEKPLTPAQQQLLKDKFGAGVQVVQGQPNPAN